MEEQVKDQLDHVFVTEGGFTGRCVGKCIGLLCFQLLISGVPKQTSAHSKLM